MQLGILGLPKSGKTTLFNTLTASRQETDKFATSDKTNMGMASVPDSRLELLRDLFKPKRYVPATIQYVDIPGMKKGESAESLDLAKLKNVDALVHVVRGFEDPELLHSEGSVDPARDVATVDLELILADHDIVERRIERLDKAVKRGLSTEEQRERALLADVILPALEAEKPLREVDARAGRRAAPARLPAPLGQAHARGGQRRRGAGRHRGRRRAGYRAAAGDEGGRRRGADRGGDRSPAGRRAEGVPGGAGPHRAPLDRVIRASFDLLGLIAFFTVGEDEVRAWTIRRGIRAREAAGTIHSDIERGFIRAEVVRWDDLLRLKTMAACREAALLRLEGKEYVVQDGDVAHFRFNV